ncbi:MAG: sulfatase-like hydrolase/transferase, partial [Verrucomicrobiota bacterium]
MKHLLALGILAASISAPSSQPNIIFIIGDDIGYGDFSCYGSKINSTPHIDSLAAGGLRFTDHHSAGAMCSPTRAAILTGLYPQRFGPDFDGALGNRDGREVGLPLAAVTVAEKLRERGYATGCFGKWHLGYSPPMIPTRQGFETFRGLLSGDGDFHTRIDRAGNPDWYDGETLVAENGYTTDLLTEHAVNFIEEHKNTPFFLYLPHLAIHFPWQGREDPPHRIEGNDYKVEKFGIIPDPSNVTSHVTAMLEAFDESVGRIVDSLKKEGLIESSLVILTSDNGGYLNYGKAFQNISSNGVFRGQKTSVHEGGHRVPLVVSWPGRIAPGISDALTHSNDWMPTLAALVGIDPPTSDGIDLQSLLFDGVPLPERTLFWRTRNAHAVRQGPWKLC